MRGGWHLRFLSERMSDAVMSSSEIMASTMIAAVHELHIYVADCLRGKNSDECGLVNNHAGSAKESLMRRWTVPPIGREDDAVIGALRRWLWMTWR